MNSKEIPPTYRWEGQGAWERETEDQNTMQQQINYVLYMIEMKQIERQYYTMFQSRVGYQPASQPVSQPASKSTKDIYTHSK